jgi:hypothetical protein
MSKWIKLGLIIICGAIVWALVVGPTIDRVKSIVDPIAQQEQSNVDYANDLLKEIKK